MEVRSGTVGNDNEFARQRLSSSRCVSIPTFHRTHESQLVGGITVFASGGKMTGDAPHAQGWRSVTESFWTLWCGTLAGPGKDTHGTPVLSRREAVGGLRHASRDTTKTTRPR